MILIKKLLLISIINFLFSLNLIDALDDPDFQAWSGRIVGGSTASAGQFRYQVSLRSTGNAHFCGGTLFHNRWVVSAAHCTIGRTAGNTIIVVGAISRTTGGTTHAVARIANHPSYNSNTLANDISLLQTSTAVATTANVAPAALGSAFVGGGASVIASGWGQTSHPGSAAANLQWVSLVTLTNADCRSRFSATNAARVFDNTICTFVGAGRGTCMGDSGGPLAQGNTVIGAVSWGIHIYIIYYIIYYIIILILLLYYRYSLCNWIPRRLRKNFITQIMDHFSCWFLNFSKIKFKLSVLQK